MAPGVIALAPLPWQRRSSFPQPDCTARHVESGGGAHRVIRRGLETMLGNEYGLGPLVAVQVMMRDDGMPERPALDYGEQRVEGLGKVRHGRSPFGLVAGE